MTSVTGQQQIVNAGFSYRTGLQSSYVSATQVNVSAGQCRDSTNTFDIFVPSLGQIAPLSCLTSFVGANGLDFGTIAPSTIYGLFVLFDPTFQLQPALLLSTSFTNPIMPGVRGVTYSAFRLVDFVTTDGSSNIVSFFNTPGTGTIYKQYESPQIVLTAGAATTFTPVSLSPAVPNLGYGRVYLNMSYVPHADADIASFRPTGALATSHEWIAVSILAQTESFLMVPLNSLGNPSIDYSLSSGTAPASMNLSVAGYEFNV